MAQLVKIGNSQGIKIPKKLIQKAHLEGKELGFKVVGNGLLVTPQNEPRKNWAKLIQAEIKANGVEKIDEEWIDSDLVSDDDWEW